MLDGFKLNLEVQCGMKEYDENLQPVGDYIQKRRLCMQKGQYTDEEIDSAMS